MVSDAENADIEDFQQLILMDMNFETFRLLEEEIGYDKAREIFRPHMLNSGTALLVNAQKHLGVTIKDISSMEYVWTFIGRACWMPSPGKMTITAKGREWHCLDGCYLKQAPPSMRRMICDDAFEGIVGSFPEFGYHLKCLDKGDGECGTILFQKEDPSMEWKSNDGKETIIPTSAYDKEKTRQFGKLAIGELWLFPTQALIEWKGPDVIAKMKNAIHPIGRKWGRMLAKAIKEDGKDMGSLLTIIGTYNLLMDQEGRTIYASPSRHETEISICPFSVAPNEMGIECGNAIGAQCEAFCNAICE